MQNWGVRSGRYQTQKVPGGPRGPRGARTVSPGGCLLMVHPCRNPPFSTVTRSVREGSMYLLSDLLGFTVISMHVPGKTSFNKLHLNHFFPLNDHNKQHFGREKNLVLKDSDLFLVELCSDFTPDLRQLTSSHQHFGDCWPFSRVLVTAGDRIPIRMELGSNTGWPFLHK